jgi:hypothetical protein
MLRVLLLSNSIADPARSHNGGLGKKSTKLPMAFTGDLA